MTNDKDFKDLIRARMAKTGESYTAARHQLLRQGGATQNSSGEAEDPGPSPRVFTLGEPAAARTAQANIDEAIGNLYADTGVVLDGDVLRVWMGQPRAFHLVAPLTSIRSARAVPDHAPGTSLGVHGSRGRWLVNATYDQLVQIEFDPVPRARLTVGSSMTPTLAGQVPRFVRLLLRDRDVKVRQLTVSVDDRDRLLEALTARTDVIRRT